MEIESKFCVPNRQLYRQLLQLQDLEGYTIVARGRVRVTDRYFDTVDRRLLAAHYSCRLREQGDQVIVTLKSVGDSDDGLHERDEHEAVLDEMLLDPHAWPDGRARELALELSGGAALEPLLSLKQVRTKADLMDGERRVAEWSLDKVRTRAGGRPLSYHELEIELGPDGHKSDLKTLTAALIRDYGLVPENRSKFVRGLSLLGQPQADGAEEEAGEQGTAGDAGPVEAAATVARPAAIPELQAKANGKAELPPLAADDPMAEAGRKVMHPHFAKMLANEAGTRTGEDIEFLHDMRVSTRRLRAAYRIFEPFYEPDAIRKFNKELRRAGGTLGAVRDLDVLIEKAQACQEGSEAEEKMDLGPLLAHWTEQREAARRELLDYLDSKSYKRFVENFRTFLLTPGAGTARVPKGEPVAHQVRHVIPRLVMERYEQVRAYEPILAGAPVTTYHQLRIDCKRLRYALEFFEPLLGREAGAIIKSVREMQELLGAMQDAHVAEGLIASFLAQQRGRKKSKPLPGVEAYLALQQEIQADLLGGFDAPWAQLTGIDFRRSLALALAEP